jgi:hypothetical protein
MFAFRDVVEIIFPAVMFAAMVIVISCEYRRKLRASGRKFKK